MKRTYRDWLLSYGEAKDEPAYDEAEARRRFEAGETFCVLFGDPEHPDPVLQVDLGTIFKVTWLDNLNRVELSYLFTQPDGWPPDELFLEQTRIRTYDHQLPLPEGESSYDEAWYFSPDGSYYAARGSRDGVGENATGHLEPDQLPTHREPLPSFGDWESITRRER